MEFIKNFIELTRAYTILMTLASCFIIFSYAYFDENFSFFNFILMTVALCCVQMGANLFDDYLDLKQKTIKGIKLEDVTFKSFRPKARLIINGTFSMEKVKIILISLFSIAILTGIYFTLISGWQVLLFMLIGGILTLFYPISTKYYCGEMVVGLAYGPLLILGGYFGLTGEYNSNLMILSWAIFFTTLVLLHTHNIMDWEFDEEEGKHTLAILSGSKENAINALKIMIISAYAIVVAGVIAQRFNPKIFYIFLTLPIATKLLESIKDYINIKDVKFEPRWYWGMFENWQAIKDGHIDFFMFRFYLARNFSFFFALFASIGAMI